MLTSRQASAMSSLWNTSYQSATGSWLARMSAFRHLIPRYKGDVPNPKGGVRGVIPSKQSYDANEGFSSPAQLERKKTYTLEEKRNEHGNAYIPWEEEADQLLCRLYDEGNSISVLAEMFERTKGAIRSRLKKLGKIS